MTSAADTKLAVQFQLLQGCLDLNVSFVVREPWTVLFGPSGSGKTTVLRTIAGFVKPAAGRIVAFDKNVLLDCASKIFVPSFQRPVRTATQGARLFPHMNVRRNVQLGTRWHSKPADTDQLVDEILQLFALRTMGERMPRELSGGEAQKAAVARAVAAAATNREPTILLLDEPFNGLDLRVRDELLLRLLDWLAVWKIPVLSVTHDVAEAFQLGAEVIKIADGKVVQQGPVEVVLAEERKRLLVQLGNPDRDMGNPRLASGDEPDPSSEPFLSG
jgi:molybdate transport system ATP-binding protein